MHPVPETADRLGGRGHRPRADDGRGNDVHFKQIVEECFAIGLRSPGKCRDRIDSANSHIGQVTKDLKDALLALREKRKDIKVVLLTYPYLSVRPSWILRSVNRQATGIWGDSYDAGANVRAVGDKGDQAQREAVDGANAAAGKAFVTIVDGVKVRFAGHETDPAAKNKNADGWVHEFTLPFAISYHPNSKGHQEEANLLIPHGDFGAAHTSAKPQGSLDLAFVIDTIGSMQPSLDAVKVLSSSMVDLLVGQTKSYRFALVTYRDQPEWTCCPRTMLPGST